MSKFSGVIGIMVNEVETSPGIWGSGIVEKPYKGELINFAQDNTNQNTINTEVNLRMGVKIFSNDFIRKNLSGIRYVEVYGAKWTVNSITPQYPHLVLTLGGEYKLNDEN